MADDELVHIESCSELAERGRSIEGVVEVGAERDVRGVRVELVRTEVSASTAIRTVEVVAQQEVAGATRLTTADRFTYSLRVPDDVVPGFTTPNGSLAWTVRAVADVLGSDPVHERPITVADLPAERPAVGLLDEATLGLVAQATVRRTQADRRNALPIGIVFLGAAVLFVVLGATRSGGEHPGAARWVTFGFAAFFLVVGAVAVGQRWTSSGGVAVATDAVAYRPGGTVIVTAANPTGDPCTIGLQSVEVRARVRGSGRNARHDAPQHELSAEWRDLPSGDHRMTFTIPADALGSFGGRTIAVAHRVVVFRHGQHLTGKRPRCEHHIVVIR